MITVPVRERSQVAEARRRARDSVLELGLGEPAAERAALVATEAATNLERHAAGGEILLIPHHHSRHPTLDLVSIDHGPGMENPGACLEDGYSTRGGAGQGLGAIRRQSDRFDIFSTPERGTVVVATIGIAGEPRSAYQVEGISSPKPGESQCGDGWSYVPQPEDTLLMVCDGLGHGANAAAASRAAEVAFAGTSANLEQAILDLDDALRETRGAAVALARLPAVGSEVEFLGIGNISGYLRSASREQRTVSFEGVVGRGGFRSRLMRYEVEDPFLGIFATDGLSMRWDLAGYRGLVAREPITIAAVLYRDHRRTRDDCTIVVTRRLAR